MKIKMSQNITATVTGIGAATRVYIERVLICFGAYHHYLSIAHETYTINSPNLDLAFALIYLVSVPHVVLNFETFPMLP